MESKTYTVLSTITQCLLNIANILKWSVVEKTSLWPTIKGITYRQAFQNCALHVQLLSSLVLQYSCYHPFVCWLFHTALLGSLKSQTHSLRRKWVDFLFLFEKAFYINPIIPRLICHWNLKQSFFYREIPNSEKKIKLANTIFILPLP